ncbi:ATP-dependent zinc metalloprotease FtsH 2 [Labeo rohita]|uniref:ATP-dependent zinc metalloprotease FtsH 2 n=1 Tax=Labeo rohita TaxID=84645 RepID=A0ABQ8LST2_LABRO|nr:ATP-dependent zinc metalloprotease FtsH 2 [Labeo rohita]
MHQMKISDDYWRILSNSVSEPPSSCKQLLDVLANTEATGEMLVLHQTRPCNYTSVGRSLVTNLSDKLVPLKMNRKLANVFLCLTLEDFELLQGFSYAQVSTSKTISQPVVTGHINNGNGVSVDLSKVEAIAKLSKTDLMEEDDVDSVDLMLLWKDLVLGYHRYQQCWVSKIAAYTFDLKHIAGTFMCPLTHVRCPVITQQSGPCRQSSPFRMQQCLDTISAIPLEDIRQGQESDPAISKIILYLGQKKGPSRQEMVGMGARALDLLKQCYWLKVHDGVVYCVSKDPHS